MKKDKYRIEHAQVCIRCEKITIEKRGGLRFQVCGSCHEQLKEMGKHWKEHGLYASVADTPIPFAERTANDQG